MGLATAASIKGKYVSSVTVSNTGLITAAYGGPKASTKIPTASTLLLSPVSNAGSLDWVCKSSTIAAKYLPSNCRP